MSLVQVGLIDATSTVINPSFMAEVARALTIQATRDFAPVWGVGASVSVLPDTGSVPVDVWPIFLVDQLPPGEGGFHMDKAGQPYSMVIASADDNEWTLDASHELLEMLADPQGSRTQPANAITVTNGKIVPATGTVQYLVEVCDPVEAETYSYEINGIMVSDFILPSFYDDAYKTGTQYSFRDNLVEPLEILPGGYISWETAEGDWQQILFVDPNSAPYVNDLGAATAGRGIRAWIDGKTRPVRVPSVGHRKNNALKRQHLLSAAIKRRNLYNV